MRGAMNRDDWQMRARELAVRGEKLPQSKLTDADTVAIRAAKADREDLLAHIREKLSNQALANRFGVHVRTIEKVTQGYSWAHTL